MGRTLADTNTRIPATALLVSGIRLGRVGLAGRRQLKSQSRKLRRKMSFR
jgi:hypothetical protein